MSFLDNIKERLGLIPAGARVFSVSGMKCEHCEAHVTEEIKKLSGIKSVQASHKKNQVIVMAEESVKDEDIKKAIADAGYTVA